MSFIHICNMEGGLKKSVLLCFVFLLATIIASGQNIELFDGMKIGEGNKHSAVFISFSDIYNLNDHPDSSAIPDISGLEFDSIQYIALDSIYRNRFLDDVKISETDSLFIYDYASDLLFSLPVNEVQVAAYLTIYASADEAPFSQRDYMIGFDIDSSLLQGTYDCYSMLVCVGKINPFVFGEMQSAVWKKANANENLPVSKDLDSLLRYYAHGNYTTGERYITDADSLTIYIQDILNKDKQRFAKRLLVLNSKTKRLVFEDMFFESESTSFAPLDEVWIGVLFKNKPAVIFGFEYVSFGCPYISFLDDTERSIGINCDNRH